MKPIKSFVGLGILGIIFICIQCSNGRHVHYQDMIQKREVDSPPETTKPDFEDESQRKTDKPEEINVQQNGQQQDDENRRTDNPETHTENDEGEIKKKDEGVAGIEDTQRKSIETSESEPTSVTALGENVEVQSQAESQDTPEAQGAEQVQATSPIVRIETPAPQSQQKTEINKEDNNPIEVAQETNNAEVTANNPTDKKDYEQDETETKGAASTNIDTSVLPPAHHGHRGLHRHYKPSFWSRPAP